jgi:glycosyltransferase involved in cell wall biosynthesis
MRVLMLGGSPRYPGGVEAFCDRSREAMARQCDWQLQHMPTDASFLRLAGIPRLLRRLWELIRQRRSDIDCVWLQYVCLPDLAYLLVARSRGHKVMVTPHLGSNWRSQSNPILAGLSGMILSLADRLALISPTQELEIRLPTRVPRSHIRNFLPEKVLANPSAEAKEEPQTLQLIHSGRLSEGKGTFRFLEACRGLKEVDVKFQARLTGGADAETYARIEKTIADYDLGDCVHLLGRVSDDRLLELLRESDMLIHLSTIDSYPLIVLESIACSTFPVCIDLAGASDMVRRYTGHVVSSREAVEQTVRFIRQQQVRQIRALSENAAGKVRRDYAWTNCASVLRSALRESVRAN